MTDDKMLKLSEVATQLGVERTTVWRMIRDRRLKAFRPTGDRGSYRVYQSVLDAYIATRQDRRG